MHKVRLGLGTPIALFLIFLAVHKVDFNQMWLAFGMANYWYLLLALPMYFFSVFLRALRWRYLLDPIKRLDIGSLFSSLTIGYMANVLMPAHLGEILRAYVLSKKRDISASSIFATIVMERVIDVFALLALTALAITTHPFPAWVKNSGYIMFLGGLGLFFLLVLLRKLPAQMLAMLGIALKPFPQRFQRKTQDALKRFISGIVPLRTSADYGAVCLLSVAIWACYGLIFYVSLHAFDFVQAFNLPWFTSLVLLVVTTIAIIIPSSPGYVGTYHYLCQFSLAMFGVSPGPALSFATVVHGVNFLPVLGLGLVLCYCEGIAISKLTDKKALDSNLPEIA